MSKVTASRFLRKGAIFSTSMKCNAVSSHGIMTMFALVYTADILISKNCMPRTKKRYPSTTASAMASKTGKSVGDWAFRNTGQSLERAGPKRQNVCRTSGRDLIRQVHFVRKTHGGTLCGRPMKSHCNLRWVIALKNQLHQCQELLKAFEFILFRNFLRFSVLCAR